MNKLVHLIFSIVAILLLGACSSCSTTRNPSIQYIDISRPDADAAIRTLQITQKIQVIGGGGESSPTEYINIYRHGMSKTIQTQGVDHVTDLGTESIIVLKDGRQIRTHNTYPGEFDYLTR